MSEHYERRIAALRGALAAIASSGLASPHAVQMARQAVDNDAYAARAQAQAAAEAKQRAGEPA